MREMNLMDNHTKISIVFGILILILHLINEYLLNYNFIITILMFIILIIYTVYSLKHYIKDKKNIKKTIYIAKRYTVIIFALLILIMISKRFLLNFIEIELYISILVGLIFAFLFAMSYLFLKRK